MKNKKTVKVKLRKTANNEIEKLKSTTLNVKHKSTNQEKQSLTLSVELLREIIYITFLMLA